MVYAKTIIEIFNYTNLNIGVIFDGNNPYTLPIVNCDNDKTLNDLVKGLIVEYVDVSKEWVNIDMCEIEKVGHDFFIYYLSRLPSDIKTKKGKIIYQAQIHNDKTLLIPEKDYVWNLRTP